MIWIPGHSPSLHGIAFTTSPVQSEPPFEASVNFVRVFVLIPSSQLLLQEDQSDQELQTQSTGPKVE